MIEKMLWMNDDIQYLFHSNIVEYDMVAASVSVSERYHLLDDDTIVQLKLLPKEQRTKRMGLLQRDDKEFSKRLIQCIKDTRDEFIASNGLTEENIISLHSDAIIFSSSNNINNIINGIEFKHKYTWSAYMRFRGIEMFYGDGAVMYKGAPEDLLNQHTLGLKKHILKIFEMIENYDPDLFTYISEFQEKYLRDKLPQYYYIPFGRTGNYKLDNLKLLSFLAKVAMKEI